MHVPGYVAVESGVHDEGVLSLVVKEDPEHLRYWTPAKLTAIRKALGKDRVLLVSFDPAAEGHPLLDLVDGKLTKAMTTADLGGTGTAPLSVQHGGRNVLSQLPRKKRRFLRKALSVMQEVEKVVREEGGKWYVFSEKGKKLSRGYDSKAEAVKRLGEIEHFKTHKADEPELTVACAVTKSSPEKRFTLGPAYIPGTLDAHGEWTDADTLQQSLWGYVRKGDRRIRRQHTDETIGEWVELMVWPFPTEVDMTMPDGRVEKRQFPANTPFMGVIWDEPAWNELVKTGKISGYSMGGRSRRANVEFEAAKAAELEKHGTLGRPGYGRLHPGGGGGGGTSSGAGDFSPKRSKGAINAASAIVHSAVLAEPAISSTILNAVEAAGGEMSEFDQRLKKPDSIARKIDDRATTRGVEPAEAAGDVRDAVRYTAVFEDADYAAGVERTYAALAAQGMVPFDTKGKLSFEGGSYKGMNVNFQDSNGLIFEVQFHTKMSKKAAMDNHTDYEEFREASTSYDRAEVLYTRMESRTALVPTPPGADRLTELPGATRTYDTFDVNEELERRGRG
jgi:hypothetical protein